MRISWLRPVCYFCRSSSHPAASGSSPSLWGSWLTGGNLVRWQGWQAWCHLMNAIKLSKRQNFDTNWLKMFKSGAYFSSMFLHFFFHHTGAGHLAFWHCLPDKRPAVLVSLKVPQKLLKSPCVKVFFSTPPFTNGPAQRKWGCYSNFHQLLVQPLPSW